MAKKLVVDFYSVAPADADGNSFEPILERVAQLPNQNKSSRLGENFYRLHLTEQVDGCWIGDIVKIRKDIAPIKADTDGNIEIIPMNDRQGLGEETAFLYCPRTNSLLLQRNRQGTSRVLFARYFEDKAALNGPLGLYPILDPEALVRMGRMRVVRKFDVRVGSIKNGDVFKGSAHSLGAIADLQAELQAPVVSIHVSMGRHRGSLPISQIRETLGSLFRFYQNGGNEVQKINVSGVDEDDEKDEFDLLNHRIVEVSEVQPDANHRLDYTARRNALHTAWRKRRAEIGRA